MARIRTIKPDFWRNPELSSVSPEAALLAIGLLNIADDEGYFLAIPKLIDADIFPLRECSMNTHGLLKQLSNIGYIKLFSGSDGRQYGLVVNFIKHQVISRPTPSKIKGLLVSESDSLSTHGVINEDSCLEGNGREEEKEEEKNNKPQAARAPRSVVSRPDDVDEQVWSDWLATRKAKKAPVTQTALDGIHREAQKAGLTLEAALQTMCERNWQGFKAEWLKTTVNKSADVLHEQNIANMAAAKAKIFGDFHAWDVIEHD
jgi:hypothetical protein